jgi:hypothetical protein
MFHVPQCRDLSPPWLNTFLSTLLFFIVAIVQLIAFLMSVSEISLPVSRNITGFCMLTHILSLY